MESQMQAQNYSSGLAVSAVWEARDGEADAVADILARLGAKARKEPGVKLFIVHRAVENPSHFLFYELFDDADAFAAHQQTEHFKTLVLQEGLPPRAKRERVQYRPI